MGDQQALEDLRSKIMASMATDGRKEQPVKRIAPEAAQEEDGTKRQRRINLPTGPRNGRFGNRYDPHPRRGVFPSGPGRDENGGGNRLDTSRFNPHSRSSPRNFPPKQANRSRYVGQQGSSPPAPFHDDNMKGVEPIDRRRRMRPTRWDVTPKGFEKVPAERAKLSGLFPQPGQPQELDRSKLERVAIHGGTKSRRTRILFEDATSNNLVLSKLGCELIIENVNSEAVDSFKIFLEKFVSDLGDDMQVSSVIRSPNDGDYLVAKFSTAECTTMVLACRTFINRKLQLPDLEWRRPNDYVQQLDHPDRLCAPDIIAVEGLKDGDELAIEQTLSDNGIKICFSKPIFGQIEGSREFTGCALVELDEMDNDSLSKFELAWFRPNEGHLVQSSSLITFQSLPKLVAEDARSVSKVLVLLNCVDPLDLKFMPFAEEIEETIKYTLDGVDTVRIKRPNVDYRLNFEHIGEGIGNIYVKFKSLEAATNAMKKIPGSKFNGRTVLCSYISEYDFNRLGVL